MDFFEWMYFTSPLQRGECKEERFDRSAMRLRVMQKAGTTARYLYLCVHRKRIGVRTLDKLIEATSTEKYGYRITLRKITPYELAEEDE